MNLKIYRAPSTRAALALAREELGEDALVIDTRKVRRADGSTHIELVAAAEPGPESHAADGHDSEPSFEDSAFLTTLAQDVGREERHSVDDAHVLDRLLASEVRPSVARSLVQQAREQSAQSLTGAVKNLLARTLGATLPPRATSQRVLAFVGPTGVGKTTTAAKLAARLGRGLGKRVGLIAADPYRVGACEQIGIYADLIGAEARIAHHPEEVDVALSSLAACDWVLVDTQGRSPREAMADEQWQGYLASNRAIEPILVLAANTRETDLDAAVDAFWGTRPSGLVFTKIDETSQLGSLVNQAVRTSLPVAFLTNGQKVPDDLVLTNADTMAEMVLSGRAA